MDWSNVLRSLQSDFIRRLADGCLLHCQSVGQYSELSIISGERLKQLREFCWVMAEKYKRVSSVRDVFISYLKGKLGEEVVKERLADFITEVDYEKRFGGDGNVDFTLTANPLIGIEVKSRHGYFNKVRWSVSVDEVQKNAVIVCVLIQEEVNEAQSEYHLVLAGFLPTQMIKLRTGKISFGIEQLFYAGGLRSYLEHLQASTSYISPQQQLFNQAINQNFITQVKIEKNSNQLYIQQGDECFNKQLYDAAIANYSQALQIHHADANTYYKRGNVFYCLKDYKMAIADFIQAININPNFAKAYIKSGLTRYKLADYYGAIEDYTQAIKINSYDAVAFQNRGDIRSFLGDSQGAIEDYTQARKINPHVLETQKLEKQKIIPNMEDNSHNSTTTTDDNHQRAIEVFTQVIEINPSDAVGYKKRGNARCDLGDYLEAIEDFTKAIELNPDDADAYFYRGNAFYELGDKSEAIEDYTQAIKINDRDADAYINRGNVRDELEDNQGARADFQVAADLYQKAGKVQEHKDTREKILDLEIEESLDVLDF